MMMKKSHVAGIFRLHSPLDGARDLLCASATAAQCCGLVMITCGAQTAAEKLVGISTTQPHVGYCELTYCRPSLHMVPSDLDRMQKRYSTLEICINIDTYCVYSYSQYTVLFSSKIFISAVPKLGLSMYLFMVYLIGRERIHKDKLKQLSDASITVFSSRC